MTESLVNKAQRAQEIIHIQHFQSQIFQEMFHDSQHQEPEAHC